MQSEDDSLIREMIDTIIREANPDTVILFGSRARGDARPDSDVDLLIVEPEPTFSPQRSRRQETARLYLAVYPQAGRCPRICCSIVAMNSSNCRDSEHHIVGRAQREGKVLHACA